MLEHLHKPVYEKRIKVLSDLIVPKLQDDEHLVDVGSGYGGLGNAILEEAQGTKRITVTGLEKKPRGGEKIETVGFDGYSIPAKDEEYDVTILADVVHHEEKPMELLKEVARVTKRMMIIKDHIPQGILAQSRISLIDWAANDPYGVKCLYRYFTVEQWQDIYKELGMTIGEEITSINLYPPLINMLFGKRLQYIAFVYK